MANVIWISGGACNGNTHSFLNAEEPTVVDLVTDIGINILFHESAAPTYGEQSKRLFHDVIAGKIPLDLLVCEGTIITGPNGTGR